MEHHAVTDLLTVGQKGGVTCSCGWSAQMVGSRSALLDVWAAHVKEREAADHADDAGNRPTQRS